MGVLLSERLPRAAHVGHVQGPSEAHLLMAVQPPPEGSLRAGGERWRARAQEWRKGGQGRQ